MIKKIIFPLTLVICILSVLFLTTDFKQTTTYFYGITDSQEQAVSFENAVLITDIKVIEGQIVDKGSVLFTAKRSELDVEQDQINSQLDELNARQSEAKDKLNAEIRVLRAKKRAELFKIDSQIKQLQSKRQMKYDLYKSITGSAPAVSSSNSDAAQQQVQSLQAQRHTVASAVQAEINSLKVQIDASQKPLLVQKKNMQNHLDEVNRQAEELIIRANFKGRIGSINFKPGEKIPSFQGIMTVHGLYPQAAKGYILESVANEVNIGQKLWITSTNGSKLGVVRGEVESLGNRIVEYPERLKKNQTVKSWGREVNISLPQNNKLLLGEKVQISFKPQSVSKLNSFIAPIKEMTKSFALQGESK